MSEKEKYNPGEDSERAESSWDKKFEKGWREGRGPDQRIMDFVEAHSDELLRGSNILDLGSGNGRNLVPLIKEGFNVTGVDISDVGLEKTQERLDQEGLTAKLVKGETRKFDGVDNESQDLVVSFGAIHHNRWQGVQESFAEVSRVLKPEKHFLFLTRSTKDTDTPDKEQIADHGFTAMDKSGNKEGVVQHYFTEDELKQLAEENNFEIVREPEESLYPNKNDSNKVKARWYVVYRKKEGS